MKLRLIQSGFANYTGQFGVIQFENGLSVDDVIPAAAIRLSGIVSCEWEDGSASGPGQFYLDNMNSPAPVFAAAGAPREPEPEAETPAEPEASEITITVTYTESELAEIADASGIVGLRKIADPLEIRGNSIRGLIDAILKIAGTPKVTQ